MLENYCDIIAIYCIIWNYREINAIIEKSIIAQGCSEGPHHFEFYTREFKVGVPYCSVERAPGNGLSGTALTCEFRKVTWERNIKNLHFPAT